MLVSANSERCDYLVHLKYTDNMNGDYERVKQCESDYLAQVQGPNYFVTFHVLFWEVCELEWAEQ